MSTRHKTVFSNSKTPSEDKVFDNNQTGENTESLQNQTPVEPNTNPTEKTQQKLLKIHDFSYPDVFTDQAHSLSIEMQHELSNFSSLDQTQAEKERLELQHQKRLKLQINCYGN